MSSLVRVLMASFRSTNRSMSPSAIDSDGGVSDYTSVVGAAGSVFSSFEDPVIRCTTFVNSSLQLTESAGSTWTENSLASSGWIAAGSPLAFLQRPLHFAPYPIGLR